MSDARDFIVTAHALERFQERFSSVYRTDEMESKRIHRECMQALEAGRVSYVPPLEFANYNVADWAPDRSRFVWTLNKERGYVIVEDEQGDMTVATVLVGEPLKTAREKLYGLRSHRAREEIDGSYNQENATKAGLEASPVPDADERESASCTDGG